MTKRLGEWVLPGYCASALLLGGSAQGIWGNLALQLGALLLIGRATLTGQRLQFPITVAVLVGLCIALPTLQLVPLPPAVWTTFPGRTELVRGYLLRGESLPWLPLSITPYETITTGLMLLPPLAVIISIGRAHACSRRKLVLTVVGAALTHCLLGFMQVTDGERWYPYAISNSGSAVGFFANANHLASLILASVPLLVAASLADLPSDSRKSFPAGRVLAVAAALLLFACLILTGSTAGLLLSVPVIGLSLLIRPQATSKGWFLGASGGALLALSAAAVHMSSLDTTARSSRQQIWQQAAEVVLRFGPAGSGLGSFEQLFRLTEDPSSVDRAVVNRAHNDYLQLALETGVPGVLVLAIFLVWWGATSMNLWRHDQANVYARAATIASGSLLAHSLVDYPLRTGANSVVFAICVLLMCVRGHSSGPNRPARHLTT